MSKNKTEDFAKWCIEQHANTNHMYDKYLPYEFHLRMVVGVAHEFKHLCPLSFETMEMACWGHDLIEDTRTSYNTILSKSKDKKATDIIYALTNEKGRNRSERANESYYNGIVNEYGATFAKLCDRIANCRYSEMTKSSMYKKYQIENAHFIRSLQFNDNHPLSEMFLCLKSILKA